MNNNLIQIFRDQNDKSITLMKKSCYYSLIWLHGLGDTANGFLQYFQHHSSPIHSGCKIKLLHAPIQPVTINGGSLCPSWYDIKGFENNSKSIDIDQVKNSLKIINNHVEKQYLFWKQHYQSDSQQMLYSRIFIGGFSQGCVISLTYALTNIKILGGVIGFSGHILDQQFKLINKDRIPILINHGDSDEVINSKMSLKLYEKVFGQNLSNVQLHIIPELQHQVNIEQLVSLHQWINKKIKCKP